MGKTVCSKKGRKSTTGKRNYTKRRKPSEHEPDPTEVCCLVCGELYSNSRPGEQWIKCSDCDGWSHYECTAVTADQEQYICLGCA